MKHAFLTALLLLAALVGVQAQTKEVKVVTTIESVVPGGLGRSRLISSDSVGTLEERQMENFFSLVGINFGNVKENDVTIAAKIAQLTNQGWHLDFVNSGVYSAGDKGTGIFITRYIFSRNKVKA